METVEYNVAYHLKEKEGSNKSGAMETVEYNKEYHLEEKEGSRPPSRRDSRGSAAPSRSSSATASQSHRPSITQDDRPPSRQGSRSSVAGSQANMPSAEGSMQEDMPSPPSRQNSKSASLAGGKTPSLQGTPENSQKAMSTGSGSPRDKILARARSRSGSGSPEVSQENMDPQTLAPPSKQNSQAGSIAGSHKSASKAPSVQPSPAASRESSTAELGGRPAGKPPSMAGSVAAGSRRSSKALDSPHASTDNIAPAEQPSKQPSRAGSIAGSQRSAVAKAPSAQGTPEASQEDILAGMPAPMSKEPSKASSAKGSPRSVSKEPSAHGTPRASQDDAMASSKQPSRAGSVAGSQRSAAKGRSEHGSPAMSREHSVAEDPSFLMPAPQADQLPSMMQDSGSNAAAESALPQFEEDPVGPSGGKAASDTPPSPKSALKRHPKPSQTPKEVPPRSPEWCLQMFGDGTHISREDLTEFLKEYSQDGRVLRLSAQDFNHMDFDCNGVLDRDEFYFFFYSWLAEKIPVEEVRKSSEALAEMMELILAILNAERPARIWHKRHVYQNTRLREEAHQLCWIFDVYKCVSGLRFDMTLRPWTALCTDAGLIDRHCTKVDAEMIFKKIIRASCNASGSEPKAGISYMEFLEALRMVSVKKQLPLADIIEDVLYVGASHRSNLDRNRYRALVNSSLTPLVESTVEDSGEPGESLVRDPDEEQHHHHHSVSFQMDREELLAQTKRSTLARTKAHASSFYSNLRWNEADSTWRRKRSSDGPANMTSTFASETPAAVPFSGFEATVPAKLSEENVKISERETELELELADMKVQRDKGNAAITRLEDKLREMEERMAMLAGENGALMDRVSRLEGRARDAEDQKQAADEYIALLEQNLAVASACAVANAQSNEEIIAELQKKAADLAARSPKRASIMDNLSMRRDARRGTRRQSPSNSTVEF